MNLEDRKIYSERDLRKKKAFERAYVPLIYKALDGQLTEAADYLKLYGERELRARLERMVFVQDLAIIIRSLWTRVGLHYANKTLKEINRSEKKAGFGFDEKWVRAILDYFYRVLLNKAVLPISQTTKEQILSILDRGEREGWGIDRMAFELKNSDITLWRARLIVRTEIAMAQHHGKNLGKEESSFETKEEWISAEDARTRHSHREIDGKQIKEGDKFKVARYSGHRLAGYDLMTGPGDPTAHAENICNCRCTSAVVAMRDANGKLIRKRLQKDLVILPV